MKRPLIIGAIAVSLIGTSPIKEWVFPKPPFSDYQPCFEPVDQEFLPFVANNFWPPIEDNYYGGFSKNYVESFLDGRDLHSILSNF